MKAVVLRAPGDVGVEEVADPRLLEPGDAIVRVRATAICGADLFPFHGLTPGFEAGTILGHEFAGEVVEAGADVASLRPGDRVVNASMISDGTCPSCRAGRVTQCEGRSLFGYSGVYPRLDGGQAELVRVPHADRALRKLPDAVSDEAAVFLADILPTGQAAVDRGGVGEGDTVVVVGCGPVGLMAVLCARGRAGRLLAVDGVPVRRELAAALGAEAAAPEEAQAAVAAATDGLGADVVIEAAGSPGGLDASLRLARGRGVVSVVGAHFEPDYPLDNALMFERELTLRFFDRRPDRRRPGAARAPRERRARPDAGRHAPAGAGRRGRGLPPVRLARGDEGGARTVRRARGAAAVALLLAGCGGGGASSAFTAAPPAQAKRLMAQRLKAKQLDYTWLACIVLTRTWRDVPLTRCNVGFGIDPHVEAYCVVLRDGRLVTNHENAAIPCRHDDAGLDGTTITSSG